MIWLALIVLILILVIWMFTIILNHWERSSYYQKALARSREVNLPLIVIGDPKKGMSCSLFGAPYGYGDVCIDIDPLETFEPHRVIKVDATDYLKTQPTGSAVIFISCVLEYVDRIDELIKELYRVAGTPQNLFVVHVKWYSPTAYIYRFQGDCAKNVITSAPPNNNYINYYRI